MDCVSAAILHFSSFMLRSVLTRMASISSSDCRRDGGELVRAQVQVRAHRICMGATSNTARARRSRQPWTPARAGGGGGHLVRPLIGLRRVQQDHGLELPRAVRKVVDKRLRAG